MASCVPISNTSSKQISYDNKEGTQTEKSKHSFCYRLENAVERVWTSIRRGMVCLAYEHCDAQCLGTTILRRNRTSKTHANVTRRTNSHTTATRSTERKKPNWKIVRWRSGNIPQQMYIYTYNSRYNRLKGKHDGKQIILKKLSHQTDEENENGE